MIAPLDARELDQVMLVMREFRHPWYIAGGWALDLALGRQTRAHADVDLCVFRDDTAALLAHFAGWAIQVAVPGGGGLVACHAADDTLPPRHELHLRRDALALEVLLMDRADDVVLFRRNPLVQLSLARLPRADALGRPYVAPAWQLLYKARAPRPQDEADFTASLAILDAADRAWLRAALQQSHPAHPWIARLAQDDA